MSRRPNDVDRARRIHLEGKTDDVPAKYLAAMATRGRQEFKEAEPLGRPMWNRLGEGSAELHADVK